MSQVKPIVVDLDELCQACGYFNSGTNLNNGYGCDHPENEETSLVRVVGKTDARKDRLSHQIEIASLRKEYGSVANIRVALETKEGKDFFAELRETKMHDKSFVAQFGCKLQGCCYSFSCPIAMECDLEDLQEYDNGYYEDWKDEDYSQSESGAQLMLIDDADLQIKLGYKPEEATT